MAEWTKAPASKAGGRKFREFESHSFRQIKMKFYEEIECEHGWTDDLGWAICDLGSGCSIDLDCFCTKEDCPIYEEKENNEKENI